MKIKKIEPGNINIYYQSECQNKTKETIDFSYVIDRCWAMIALHTYVHLWCLCNYRVWEMERNSAQKVHFSQPFLRCCVIPTLLGVHVQQIDEDVLGRSQF